MASAVSVSATMSFKEPNTETCANCPLGNSVIPRADPSVRCHRLGAPPAAYTRTACTRVQLRPKHGTRGTALPLLEPDPALEPPPLACEISSLVTLSLRRRASAVLTVN
jgi:hypothetical protein